MQEENASHKPGTTKTQPHTKVLRLFLFAIFIILSGWVAVVYLRNTYLVEYVRSTIESNFSILRVVAPAGLITLIASLSLQRRFRSRESQNPPRKMDSLSFGTNKPVHPLMMIQRPARDSKFVIRKTRNRGRISRNRAGERLPPNNPE